MLRTRYRRPHLGESYTILASQVVRVNNSKDLELWRKALHLVLERFGESDPRHTPTSQIFWVQCYTIVFCTHNSIIFSCLFLEFVESEDLTLIRGIANQPLILHLIPNLRKSVPPSTVTCLPSQCPLSTFPTTIHHLLYSITLGSLLSHNSRAASNALHRIGLSFFTMSGILSW